MFLLIYLQKHAPTLVHSSVNMERL